MSAFLTGLVRAQEKSIADEGRDIIVSVLVLGLIFLSVIALGQFSPWLPHRRRRGPSPPGPGHLTVPGAQLDVTSSRLPQGSAQSWTTIRAGRGSSSST